MATEDKFTEKFAIPDFWPTFARSFVILIGGHGRMPDKMTG